LTVETIIVFYLAYFPGPQQATVSPIGPDELPPPYTAATAGGVPMVTCRVCQAMIDISGKRDQHVVKCRECSEATVSFNQFQSVRELKKNVFAVFIWEMHV
jgi:hypothetical protein